MDGFFGPTAARPSAPLLALLGHSPRASRGLATCARRWRPAVAVRLHWFSLTIALLLTFAVGCSSSKPVAERVASKRDFGDPAVLARVGASGIAGAAVRRAAADCGGSIRSALERLVVARVYGLYAAGGGLDRGRRQMVERAVLGRALLERIEAQSKNPATPSDAEVEAMTRRRWIEFDRPEAVRTCHVLVHAQNQEPAVGLSLAQRLAEALLPLTRCQDFIENAKSFPSAGAKVTAESLPPLTIDGRTLILNAEGVPVDEGATFDQDFARGAHQIKTVGTQSSLIRTSFGWHIILLEGKVPPKRLALEERREAFAVDILLQRARDRSEQQLSASRKRTRIVVERAAIETAGRVQVLQ
jgi:hypothetical protein